jgi:hypothetical protein
MPVSSKLGLGKIFMYDQFKTNAEIYKSGAGLLLAKDRIKIQKKKEQK